MKEQLAVRCTASVAVQVTMVDPSGNVEPLGGVQNADVGVVPPVTTGDGYETTADWPFRVVVVTGGATGHVIAGGGMIVVCEGRVGLSHPIASHAAAANADKRKRRF